MKIHSWPKVYAFGHRHNRGMLANPVSVTEKIDGSQFKFGNQPDQTYLENGLIMKSKGATLFATNTNKMFTPAVNTVTDLYKRDLLPENVIFYSETLSKPLHNVIEYDRVPKGNIALFGAYEMFHDVWLNYADVEHWAFILGIDVVPQLFNGDVPQVVMGDEQRKFDEWLLTDSFLGGSKVEGFVMMDLSQDYMIGDQYFPFTAAKVVAPEFQEKHNSKAYGKKATKASWHSYCEGFRTEARWDKAIQHLRELGQIDDEFKDIGPIIREIHQDITDEEGDEIKLALWNFFKKDLLATAIQGFPEYYKKKITEG